MQEIREATDYQVPIQLKLGAARVYDDVRMAAKCGPDIIYLDGAEGGTGAGPHIATEETGIPLMAAIPEARRALEDVGLADEIDLVVAGGIRNGADVAKCLALGAKAVAMGHAALMALNCNKEIPGVTDYEGTVGVPAGQCYHCHTGRCPVGITTQDPELRKRLVVEEASERVYNFLTALTMELQMLARACGKTNVHSLEPEDLAALTIEASAMARVPLAGTNYTVGQTEHEILAEVKRLLAIKAEEELDAGQAARSPTCGRWRHDRVAGTRTSSPTPSRRRSSRSTPSSSSGHRFPYQEDISLVEDVDLDAATPGEDLNWLEDIDAARGGRRACGLRPLQQLLPQDLLPDPERPGARDRAQGADGAPRVRQLLRDPAEGEAHEVPPARARPLGRGLEDGRRRLAGARPRGLGEARRSLTEPAYGVTADADQGPPARRSRRPWSSPARRDRASARTGHRRMRESLVRYSGELARTELERKGATRRSGCGSRDCLRES